MIVVLFLLCGSWQGPGALSAQTYNEEALCRLRVFDFNGAVADFQAARSLDPESLVVRVNLSLAYFYAGDMEAASLELRHVLDSDPNDPYARFLAAVIADRQGRTQTATNEFRNLLELVPGDPGTYYHLGLLALRREEPEEAVKLFEQSLAGNPGCTASLYNLGRALISSGRKKEGAVALEKFRALQSEKPPGPGGGMGDPALLVGKYGQPRRLLEQ